MIQLLSAKLTLVSEGESNYNMLLWETAERGEFSIESLLIFLKYLHPVNSDNLLSDVDERLAQLEGDESILFNRRNCFIYSLEQDRSNKKSKFSRRKFLSDGSERQLFRETILARLIDIRQKFQALSEVLKPILANMQVYRLSTSDLDFQRFYDVYLLIGQTQEGKWIGFSTKINYHCLYEDKHSPALTAGRDTETISSETRSIIKIVENIVSDYTFLPQAPYYFGSEIVEPFKSFSCFIWEITDDRSGVVEQLLESNNFMQVIPLNCKGDYYPLLYIYPEDYDIDLTKDGDRELYLQQTIESLTALEYDTPDAVLEYDKSDYEQELYARQTIKLLDTFDSELTEQKAYRFGLCSIDLYFIGTTPAGDKICLSGEVVET